MLPAAILADLALAPAVIALRLPLLAAEGRVELFKAGESWTAWSEKAEAVAEGLMAAQLSLGLSALTFWPDLMAGRKPAALAARSLEQAAAAALRPAGRRVRANYRRLSRR